MLTTFLNDTASSRGFSATAELLVYLG